MGVNTMTTGVPELELPGCTPEPLMAYLKALGVFRLVAEQKDPAARGYWRNDQTFVLRSSLDREALLGFFLKEYRPTPVVAPWNGGSGFYTKDNRQAISAITQSNDLRMQPYRQVIELAHRVLNDLPGEADSGGRNTAIKDAVLAQCRNSLPESAVSWLDAAYVLSTDGPRYPPLLGTGGNDGRLEFTNNFMQNILLVLSTPDSGPEQGRRRGRPAVSPQEWLSAALFNDAQPALTKGAIGQFNPGGVGGPNATAGFEGDSLTNPWDYVLMMEGALFFAGAVARRLSAESRSRAVFPFTVETSAAGYGTAVDTEYTSDGSRAELWAPLWQQPATYGEVSHLFGEGRAQLGRRQASTGTDFARAVTGLGVERGISSFQRFGFLKRNGLAFIATPLGRFRVTPKPEANLLFDLDPWLDSLRRAGRGQNAPEGLNRTLREIDRAILEFCAHSSSGVQRARLLQEVLIAVGLAEGWLATSRLKESIRPLPGRSLPGLSPEWLKECDDHTPEFRLAAALASIQGTGEVGSIRVNLEPVTFDRGRWQWAEDQRSVVWHGGDVFQAMAAVMERRCLEASMESLHHLPLEGRIAAPLADIYAFLEGRVDYRRMADLLLPLTAINWREPLPHLAWYGESVPPALSRAYAALKLLFLPWPFRRHAGVDETPIRPEPSILPLLRGGRISDAYQIAHRRLRASGLVPLSPEAGIPRGQELRLGAALLIPIRYRDMHALTNMALTPASEAR